MSITMDLGFGLSEESVRVWGDIAGERVGVHFAWPLMADAHT